MAARTNGNGNTKATKGVPVRKQDGAAGRGKKPSARDDTSNGREKPALDASYNTRKDFHGQQYTGMKVGRGHKWKYDPGEWVEKKVTPDKWEFHFDVTKRRAGKAPEGSGVPVGTEYHWYVLAHQTATKVNANDYETRMFGLKYKLAHKRADKASWSASEAAQTRRLIRVLKELIADLEREPPKAATEKTARDAAEPKAATAPAARTRKRLPRKNEPSRAAAA
jgi:hypothetical protein